MNDLKEKIRHGNQQLPLEIYHTTLYEGIHDLPLHYHKEMEIIYIQAGRGTFQINLESYEVSEGDLLIIKSGVLHGGIGDRTLGCKCLTLVFDLTFLESSTLDACQMNYIQPILENEVEFTVLLNEEVDTYHQILTHLNTIVHSHHEQVYGFELVMKAHFYLLFSLFMRSNKIRQASTVSKKKLQQSQRLKDVLDYIHVHYSQPISIKELATVVAYSEYHFMRFFKEQVGMTCTEYIMNIRLKQAKALLLESSLPITEIASEVGFETLPYFSKKFKETYNLSPSQYRKAVLSDNLN